MGKKYNVASYMQNCSTEFLFKLDLRKNIDTDFTKKIMPYNLENKANLILLLPRRYHSLYTYFERLSAIIFAGVLFDSTMFLPPFFKRKEI